VQKRSAERGVTFDCVQPGFLVLTPHLIKWFSENPAFWGCTEYKLTAFRQRARTPRSSSEPRPPADRSSNFSGVRRSARPMNRQGCSRSAPLTAPPQLDDTETEQRRGKNERWTFDPLKIMRYEERTINTAANNLLSTCFSGIDYLLRWVGNCSHSGLLAGIFPRPALIISFQQDGLPFVLEDILRSPRLLFLQKC